MLSMRMIFGKSQSFLPFDTLMYGRRIGSAASLTKDANTNHPDLFAMARRTKSPKPSKLRKTLRRCPPRRISNPGLHCRLRVQISRITEVGTLYLVFLHSQQLANAVGFSRSLALRRPRNRYATNSATTKRRLSPLSLTPPSRALPLGNAHRAIGGISVWHFCPAKNFSLSVAKNASLIRILSAECVRRTERTKTWTAIGPQVCRHNRIVFGVASLNPLTYRYRGYLKVLSLLRIPLQCLRADLIDRFFP
jgi:hypothetical protein